MRALRLILASAFLWVGAGPASAAVEIGPQQVVVSGSGARAVIERNPFRITFQDGAGRDVLRQVENPLTPGGAITPDPEPGGLENLPEAARYAPLTFQFGGAQGAQHPGGLWTGNMLVGVEAGVVHGPTEVIDAVPDADGVKLRLATTDPLTTLEVLVHPDIGSGIRVRATVPGAVAMGDSFESVAGEAFHGFGGRHNSIDQRGRDFYNWVEEEAFGAGPIAPIFEPLPGTGGDTYLFPNGPSQAYYVQNIFISSRPYGFLLNETELSRWRMAADRPNAWQATVRGDSLDYTVAVGDGPDAIGAITAISGRHRLGPEWSIGPMVKRNVQQGNSDPERQQQLIAQDLKDIERYGVELDGFAYESWDTLDPEFVRQTNAKLKSMGIHPIGYVRAYVNDEGNFDPPGTFDEAVSNGYVAETPAGTPFISVAVGPAALIDFTNPEAVAWWERRKIRKMLDLGFDGFMQDFGEQALEQMHFHDGSTGVEMHNRYPILFHKVTREILDRYEAEHPERGELWMYTRSGFSGRPGSAAYESSNFPGDETADWQRSLGLPSLATDMLNRGVGGAYGFTTDIGGYFDSYSNDVLDDELFSRWSEWAALSPHFRLHNSCCTNGTQMPWDFKPETLERWKKQSALHGQARPLIRDLWREAVETGMPITRPLWLAYPGDAEAAKQDQQWLLGPDVLVAPVVRKGATGREVYFPRGCWEHPETDERFNGPRAAKVDAPLGRLPYFFRCGTNPFAQAAGKRGCLARRSPIGPRNIGRVRLGLTRRGALRRIGPQPIRRTRRSFRWCVKRSSGRVTAVFSRSGKRGRITLVTTTARAHGNRGVRPGSPARKLRRAFTGRSALTRGVLRAFPGSPRLIGVARGRVRYFAVAHRRLLRRPAALRRHLRLAGVGR